MSPGEELRTRPGLALPAGWDPARDLFVWVGPPGPALPRGERVFVAPCTPSEEPAAPAGARAVRSGAELFQAVLTLVGAAPVHVLVHRTPPAAPERARELATSLANALRARAMQQKTVAETGVTWLRQGLGNLPALAAHPSIVALRGAFAGTPCVLVSPGPSLSKNVHALRTLAGRAVIVSGTHALSALAHAEVTPHFVLCADPGDLGRHWEGLDLRAVEAFVVGATCRAEAFAVPARRHLTFASNGALDAWLFEPLGETPNLATGGSVACSMLSFALLLGCDPVVFVGQDLSFTERFYAAEGLDGDARVASEGDDQFTLVKPAGATGIGVPLADGSLRFTPAQRILEIPGWGGGTVRTTPQLKAFRDWFEAVAPELAGATRLLNCTEGGARIDGMEHVPLAAASAGWTPRGALEPALARAEASIDPRARRGTLKEWSRRTLGALESCVESARRCRALAGANQLAELGRAEKKLAQNLRGAPLVSLVAQAEITRAREGARTGTTLAHNLEAACELYAVVERAGELLTEPLRAAWRALR